MDEKRKKALDQAITSLRKSLGQSAIMLLGDTDALDIDVIPSGSLALDIALGVGGYPRGRVTEIYGPEGSGKSTMALHAIAEAQKMGEVAALVDVENALDPTYAAKIGVDVDALYVSQPDSGENALEVVDALVRSNAVGIVVVDSVAALVPRAEIEGDIGASLPGIQARLMSQFLRRISSAVKQSNTALIFINQIRYKIGVMFGSPETTSGGVALKFYSTIRLDVRQGQKLKLTSGDIYGHKLRLRCVKNKVASPFRKCECDLVYSVGISHEAELVRLGVEFGVIEGTGSHHYRYGEMALGHGTASASQMLSENPEMAAEIEEKIREAAGLYRERKGSEDGDIPKEGRGD